MDIEIVNLAEYTGYFQRLRSPQINDLLLSPSLAYRF